MLNEELLGSILKQELPHSLTISDIHWRTQDADAQSLLFYRLSADDSTSEQFFNRIKLAQFAWLVVNKSLPGLPENCSVIDESFWPEIQKSVCDLLYPLPLLKFIAVTGTNGKTTTTDLVLQMGEMIGIKGFSIGTLGVRENGKTLLNFGLTSPPFIDLRKYLNLYGTGKEFCVVEASSHALTQQRLFKLKFDGAGWLSFSQDHLDYHQTMDSYFEAKALLINQLKDSARLFIPSSQKILLRRVQSLSSQAHAAQTVSSPLPLFFKPRFNQDNLEVAAAIIKDLFKTNNEIDFSKLTGPDGRFYIKPYGTNFIVVDFAHTPDALENICRGLKSAFPHHRLKVLFGCGGDRDRIKRSLMGAVVEKWAECIYLTSDNPRGEDPMQIMQDIAQGIKNKKFASFIDRKEAVAKAFSELTQNEVLLLAGKGHEDYILIKNVKIPYSDIKEVDALVLRNKHD